jgi:hypothetical protein
LHDDGRIITRDHHGVRADTVNLSVVNQAQTFIRHSRDEAGQRAFLHINDKIIGLAELIGRRARQDWSAN